MNVTNILSKIMPQKINREWFDIDLLFYNSHASNSDSGDNHNNLLADRRPQANRHIDFSRRYELKEHEQARRKRRIQH